MVQNTLIILIVSSIVLILCGLHIKKFRTMLVPMGLVGSVSMTFAIASALVLTGVITPSHQNNPKAAAAEFFSCLRQSQLQKADTLLGGDVFCHSSLSEDARSLLPALSHVQDMTLLGDPVYDGSTAVQTVQITHTDHKVLKDCMYSEAYHALSSMMVSYEKTALFTDDEAAYLPGVREEAWETALTAVPSALSAHTVTQQLDVTLQWTPIGWYVRPSAELFQALIGCDSPKTLTAELSDLRTSVLEELPVLQKLRLMEPEETVAPTPDTSRFLVTTDPMEVADMIEDAADLLNGQTMSWNPEISFAPDTQLLCYRDDSILVVIWKEVLDNCLVTFSEVKLAHPEQMFRTLCQDTYMPANDDRKYEKPTEMARRSNAVVAVTGDFYRYRSIGTVVYQGELCRLDPNSLDMCFFDNEGNMHFVRRKEMDAAELTEYIQDNNFRFSVSFGPVLIQDGEIVKTGRYPIGENNGKYDRCVMGQLDDLHYIFLTANFTSKYRSPTTLSQAQTFLYDKGCIQGYALDGGQTGAIIFDGELVNRVNYGGERRSSDMICFATAVDDQ